MPGKTAGDAAISDAAVKKATGHGWAHWFKALDKFRAAEKGHAAAAKHLRDVHGTSGWWSQMITVQYERQKGLRVVNQSCNGGYQVSVSRTISAPVESAWDAFAKASKLNKWFTFDAKQRFVEGGQFSNGDGDHGEFRRIVPMKRIRFTWNSKHHKPGSVVEVRFTDKGEKCGVTLGHSKLSSSKEVEDLRKGWSWAMDSLKSYLETGRGIKYEDWEQTK